MTLKKFKTTTFTSLVSGAVLSACLSAVLLGTLGSAVYAQVGSGEKSAGVGQSETAKQSSIASASILVTGDNATVRHPKGQSLVPLNPKTVVVFDLATLDILNALGVKSIKGVPGFKMPEHLKEYEMRTDLQKVGSLFEPDYEAIRALKPDVILIGRRSEAKFDDLDKLAPTVDMSIDEAHPVDSIYSNVRVLGQLFGKQSKAEELIAQTQQSIAQLRSLTPTAGTALVLLSSGGRINNYGPGSRFGMIFDVFRFNPVKNDPTSEARHGQAISFEYILQSNPDWLLVMDRDSAIGREGDAAKQLLDNALINATNAARKKQIVYLNAANWYVLDGAGIQALQSNVEQLRAAVAAAAAANK